MSQSSMSATTVRRLPQNFVFKMLLVFHKYSDYLFSFVVLITMFQPLHFPFILVYPEVMKWSLFFSVLIERLVYWLIITVGKPAKGYFMSKG